MQMRRPMPPNFVTESIYSAFAPELDLPEFVERMFLNEHSEFYNEDHAHLVGANIGYLWTNVANERQMKRIAANAQMPNIQSSKWNKEIFDYQLKNWFGSLDLNFLITIDANYAVFMDDVSFCALIEHELYHCALKGFTNKGLPIFGMRDHDVTEFLGITRRYGADVSLNVPELVDAASRPPLFSTARISAVCGNCMGLRI
jgi:hypothetical protein